MADSGEKDKKPEEKPKVSIGIIVCLAFSTLAFVLILVLLFEGRTPAAAAGQQAPAATAGKQTLAAAAGQQAPAATAGQQAPAVLAARAQPEPSETFRKTNELSAWIRRNVRMAFVAKEFYENGAHLGEDFRESVENVVKAWERILDVKE